MIKRFVEADSDDPATIVDVHMMTVCDEGRERSRADLERLLQASGYRVGRSFVTTTRMGIIEGVAT